MFHLRFRITRLSHYATRFPDDPSETTLAALRPRVLGRGHLTRAEFLNLCERKSPRTRPWCEDNPERTIITLSRATLASDDDGLKIDLLRILRGVEYPTASFILHFCDARPYPILDIRALWSLGYDKPPRYTTEFWLEYVAYTRALAARVSLDMRTLDKALWQYSKERQM